MKPKFNKTWLWISLIIIANIVIFSFLSKRLESYISTSTENQGTLDGVKYLD